MDIVFNTLGMPFNGETLMKESLGGSETACYYLARGLAALGHNVLVFTNMKRGTEDEGVWDNVQYSWAGPMTEAAPLGDRFEFYARNTPHDVLIIQRHPQAFMQPYASKVNLWQTHDLALVRYLPPIWQKMWNVDRVLAVSDWHKKQICDVYSFPERAVAVVPNGVDLSLYGRGEDIKFKGLPEGKFLLLYQSRPERGLEHLVREGGIMERLLEKAPNAHLVVAGYDNTTREMAEYYAHLWHRCIALPNVTRLGALDKQTLAALQERCDLLVYPSEFEETSCITAMEAMAAGLPMLGSYVGALPETCDGSGASLVQLKDGKADEDEFVATLPMLMQEIGNSPELKDRQLAAAKLRTWGRAAEALDNVIADCMAGAKPSRAGVLRHALDVSDVYFAKWFVEQERAKTNGHATVGLWETMIERELPLYTFADSREAYVSHYKKHGDAYYNGPWQNQRREDVTHQPRYIATMQMLNHALKNRESARVLDYGCAHGHYLVRMAQHFPQHRFYGVDVNERAVTEARRWIEELQLTNCQVDLISDPFTGLEKYQTNLAFDAIVCAETLEHVPDYLEFLEQLRKRLTDSGHLVLTTPYGGWERIGYFEHQTGREHLHHFERADLREIFAQARFFDCIFACAGTDNRAFLIGSWVSIVQPGDGAFHAIDYERKLRELAPRQTVSACMIVKDGERVIGKCLDSLAPWVDEIVIGVDQNTSDGTVDVLERFKDTHPTWPRVQIIDIPPAVEIGFGPARNITLEHATGDWIWWQDADEELVRGAQMHRLLRASMHDAYNTAQVHYAADPPAVMETDFPTRLFRNGKGIRFYGLVHEHPETVCGTGIPHSFVTHHMKVLHNGYITEDVRKQRFIRNLPLLIRDCEAHPERVLNHYLRVRDVAQSINFELQQTGGTLLPHHPGQAQQGVDLWERLLNEKPQPRLLLQSLQYYSALVAFTGKGDDYGFRLGVAKTPPVDLRHAQDILGRFSSKEIFTKFFHALLDDQTKGFESRYW